MGPSLDTSLSLSSTVAEPNPPRPTPSPHLLSHGGVLCGPPQTVCYMILVQWRAAGVLGHSDGGSTEGPIKSLRHVTVGHLLSTVADELWEILACTQTSTSVPLASRTGAALGAL